MFPPLAANRRSSLPVWGIVGAGRYALEAKGTVLEHRSLYTQVRAAEARGCYYHVPLGARGSEQPVLATGRGPAPTVEGQAPCPDSVSGRRLAPLPAPETDARAQRKAPPGAERQPSAAEGSGVRFPYRE